ncbi:MAG: Transcriptional activator flo8 [Icmadophila ericetorum]|nr:Transcriptional activator flo8 [Icmadophila ericetorum]
MADNTGQGQVDSDNLEPGHDIHEALERHVAEYQAKWKLPWLTGDTTVQSDTRNEEMNDTQPVHKVGVEKELEDKTNDETRDAKDESCQMHPPANSSKDSSNKLLRTQREAAKIAAQRITEKLAFKQRGLQPLDQGQKYSQNLLSPHVPPPPVISATPPVESGNVFQPRDQAMENPPIRTIHRTSNPVPRNAENLPSLIPTNPFLPLITQRRPAMDFNSPCHPPNPFLSVRPPTQPPKEYTYLNPPRNPFLPPVLAPQVPNSGVASKPKPNTKVIHNPPGTKKKEKEKQKQQRARSQERRKAQKIATMTKEEREKYDERMAMKTERSKARKEAKKQARLTAQAPQGQQPGQPHARQQSQQQLHQQGGRRRQPRRLERAKQLERGHFDRQDLMSFLDRGPDGSGRERKMEPETDTESDGDSDQDSDRESYGESSGEDGELDELDLP